MEKKRWNPFVTCGIIVISMVLMGAFFVVGGISALAKLFSPPSGLNIVAAIPAEVEYGEDFQIVIQLENTSGRRIEITDIYIPNMDLAMVTGVEPASSRQDVASDSTIYYFDLVLLPEEKKTITFYCRAIQEGYYSGEIEVWSGTHSTSRIFTLFIQPSSTPETPSPAAAIMGVYRAVVQITAMIELNGEVTEGSSGTGAIISSDGLILTNSHTVLSGLSYNTVDFLVSMTTGSGLPAQPLYYAELMQVDTGLDIAVLRINKDIYHTSVDSTVLNLPFIPLGSSDTLYSGIVINILTYPENGGDIIMLTSGKLLAFDSDEDADYEIGGKALRVVYGKDIGGVVVNNDGELLGILINSDIVSPINAALPFIQAAQRGEVQNLSQMKIPYQPKGTVILQDDFSSETSGWSVGSTSSGFHGYVSGALSISVDIPQYLVWSKNDGEYLDVIVLTTATVQQSIGNGGFGIICRYVDPKNFYTLEVTEDGLFSVWKYVNGVQIFILEPQTSEIIPASGPISMAAECIDNSFRLAVNDILLADIADESGSVPARGALGLLAETWEIGGFTVSFDDLTIFEP
ncbi:MAG: serine protease [Chloroflexota bacterium]